MRAWWGMPAKNALRKCTAAQGGLKFDYCQHSLGMPPAVIAILGRVHSKVPACQTAWPPDKRGAAVQARTACHTSRNTPYQPPLPKCSNHTQPLGGCCPPLNPHPEYHSSMLLKHTKGLVEQPAEKVPDQLTPQGAGFRFDQYPPTNQEPNHLHIATLTTTLKQWTYTPPRINYDQQHT